MALALIAPICSLLTVELVKLDQSRLLSAQSYALHLPVMPTRIVTVECPQPASASLVIQAVIAQLVYVRQQAVASTVHVSPRILGAQVTLTCLLLVSARKVGMVPLVS